MSRPTATAATSTATGSTAAGSTAAGSTAAKIPVGKIAAGKINTAKITARIAAELSAAPWQVQAAVDLLDGGATVPFIARYRKEATGSLDDAQLRTLTERLDYLRELEDRRGAVTEAITAQGKMTDALAARIADADTKSRLEDIYLPFKVKRRTKAQIAREAGLEPLADLLLRDPSANRRVGRSRFRLGGEGRAGCGRRADRCAGDPRRTVR